MSTSVALGSRCGCGTPRLHYHSCKEKATGRGRGGQRGTGHKERLLAAPCGSVHVPLSRTGSCGYPKLQGTLAKYLLWVQESKAEERWGCRGWFVSLPIRSFYLRGPHGPPHRCPHLCVAPAFGLFLVPEAAGPSRAPWSPAWAAWATGEGRRRFRGRSGTAGRGSRARGLPGPRAQSRGEEGRARERGARGAGAGGVGGSQAGPGLRSEPHLSPRVAPSRAAEGSFGREQKCLGKRGPWKLAAAGLCE